jgi:hypothetical protein
MTMTPSPPDPDRAGSSPYPPEMRASDADRDRVAELLRDAAGDGRLTLEELQERLNAVYSARTYAELEPITRDLPSPSTWKEAAPYTPPFADSGVKDAPSWRTAIAIMSGFDRKGVWTVPKRFTSFAFWGGGRIDLREARYTTGEVRIRAIAVMGGIEIIAPPDLTLHVKGLGIMGGYDDHASGPGAAGSPRVVVSGFAFWGGVSVRRKERRQAKKLRQEQERERRELED